MLAIRMALRASSVGVAAKANSQQMKAKAPPPPRQIPANARRAGWRATLPQAPRRPRAPAAKKAQAAVVGRRVESFVNRAAAMP